MRVMTPEVIPINVKIGVGSKLIDAKVGSPSTRRLFDSLFPKNAGATSNRGRQVRKQ